MFEENVKPILVAQYPELACRCGTTVAVRCAWCDVTLRTHVQEVIVSGPDAEIFCPRCVLIVALERKMALGAPALVLTLQASVATHAKRN